MTEQPGVDTPTPDREQDHAVADAVVDDVPKRPGRGRRLLRWCGWSAAGLGVLALCGLSAYLVVITNQWEDRVEELTAISTDLGQHVADAQAAQAEAEARMAAAQAERDNATSRITDLANEEAQAKDREAVLIDYVDAMISCANNRQELINVLTDSRYYFPGKTNAQVEREATTYCDGVEADFIAFTQEIAQ